MAATALATAAQARLNRETRMKLTNKTIVVTGVSSGIGGAYPISELRASSYKNCRLCYLPEHLIVRQVEKVLNGPQPVDEADERIRARIDARGEDIYGRSGVVRDVYSFRGTVVPGNSGGPLLAPNGRVYGVVFAAGLGEEETGYAITAEQATRLQDRLGPGVRVRHAMRYGRPEIGDELRALMDEGCERILLAPLYPQYSGATTATVVDKAADKLRTMRWQPAIRTLPPYHDDPVHIDAVAADLGAAPGGGTGHAPRAAGWPVLICATRQSGRSAD